MISVYVFWIHHEETRGAFDFTGRRDVRKFITLAQDIGLKILLRIGPWDHGECRNGGHPDWVLADKACGEKLRSTDPKYMACVEGWYQALAGQLKGLYHKDGGPIVMLQVIRSRVEVRLEFSELRVEARLEVRIGLGTIGKRKLESENADS